MGGIHAEISSRQQCRHGIRLQPPGVHRDARHFALLLGPQRRCHAHRYRNAKLCQLLEKRRPSVVPLNTTAFTYGTPAA